MHEKVRTWSSEFHDFGHVFIFSKSFVVRGNCGIVFYEYACMRVHKSLHCICRECNFPSLSNCHTTFCCPMPPVFKIFYLLVFWVLDSSFEFVYSLNVKEKYWEIQEYKPTNNLGKACTLAIFWLLFCFFMWCSALESLI